jgi:hypothetical protein
MRLAEKAKSCRFARRLFQREWSADRNSVRWMKEDVACEANSDSKLCGSSFDKFRQLQNGVEIVGNNLMILNFNGKFLLEERDEFQDTRRINDSILDEGIAFLRGSGLIPKKEIIDDIILQALFYCIHSQLSPQYEGVFFLPSIQAKP